MTKHGNDQFLTKLFAENFQRLNGLAETACTPQEAASKAVRLIASNGGKSVYKLKLFHEIDEEVSKTLSEAGLESAAPSKLETSVDVLKRVDAGISTAVAAVAETGTLVEAAYDDVERLTSSFPKIHIVFVKASTVVAKVEELSGLIRRTFQNARQATVTFISGPSRSGDIEQRIVVGLHGPHVVGAVVLSWL
ncbi:MAG: lactate utilization protein [Candidatus Caldarchaeum sp.]|nr:lactate utilization protein [Candidatus Caldarchaeum sp.]